MLAVTSFLRFWGTRVDVLLPGGHARRVGWGGCVLYSLGALACEGEYDLAPTFCDDWCKATSVCGAQPANCVSNCELTRATDDCAKRQQDLLSCYQEADKDDFLCLPAGNQRRTRVRAGVCQGDRDALFECEAPGIGLCLTACRDAQSELLGSTTESDVVLQNADGVAREQPDGGVVNCPTLDDPCEAQCWSLFAFTSAGLAAAGVNPEAPSASDLPAGATAAIAECAQEALLSCYPVADAGAPPSLLESIQQCVVRQGLGGPRPGQGPSDAGALPERPPAFERVNCDLPAALAFCGGGTCHYDSSQEFGSDLALVNRDSHELLSDVEERLLNVPASYHNVSDPSTCPAEPELLIDPVNIEQSLLLKKLTGEQTCGTEMPKFPYPEWGATNNPGDQRGEFVACIREWIALLAEDYSKAQ